MMSAAFRAGGIRATYEASEIPPDRWPAAMERLFEQGIDGMNVTVPLKEAALGGARSVRPAARSIGAANTLIRESGGWAAENTDGPGFRRWMTDVGVSTDALRETLVLGAGGSARAVVWALRDAGAGRIRIANRTPARAERIAAEGAAGSEVCAEPPGGDAPPGGLVVNCTSLGLRPDDPPPIGRDALEGAAWVLDLVYPDTALVRLARGLGIPAEHGLGMLVHQGARSFELWTGEPADREAMLAAARAELERRRA